MVSEDETTPMREILRSPRFGASNLGILPKFGGVVPIFLGVQMELDVDTELKKYEETTNKQKSNTCNFNWFNG